MLKFFLFLLVIAIVFQIAKIAVITVIVGAVAIAVILCAIWTIREIYHFFSPAAKFRYLEKRAVRKRQQELQEARLNSERLAKKQQQATAEQARQEKAEADAAEKREARARDELARQRFRDADSQDLPYTYQIGRHGNESLAIRYGIANQQQMVKEYVYFSKGGTKKRNPERDIIYWAPSNSIRLRKIGKIKNNLFNVLLTDYRDRPARALIEPGTEYVKTFYPLQDQWFQEQEELERVLKGNGTFTLKELATFHVQKAVHRKGDASR